MILIRHSLGLASSILGCLMLPLPADCPTEHLPAHLEMPYAHTC